MKIEKILAGIRGTQAAEKQASVSPSAPESEKTASAQSGLVTAMKEALTASEKTAAETTVTSSPVHDVMKVAQEIAGAEKEAAIKEAQLLGAAFADAAVARLGDWSKIAQQVTAAAPAAQATQPVPGNSDFGKFAQQNPELVKQAKQLGYEQAKVELEKQAQDSYVQGYNDTVETIHKTAALEFLKAASITSQIIKASITR